MHIKKEVSVSYIESLESEVKRAKETVGNLKNDGYIITGYDFLEEENADAKIILTKEYTL
ncbi:hypothetical protein [Priestia aryabhattai]|uniref:hypothetical protein n=1 Tax=Priestia aryabhattai TaxID=412384 RepID=UPI0015F3D8A3|nr:hypothetical protein [Priestia aryabhattai]